MIPDLWKHVMCCGWGCLTSFKFYTLRTPVPSHWWISFDVLLNWPLWTLRHVWVHLFGKVPVSVEPFWMVSGGVSSPPSIQQVIDPTCWISYGLFGYTHVTRHGIPVGILWAILDGKWREFLIQPVRSISGLMRFSSRGHESHYRLIPWMFISCLCRS